MSEKRTPSKRTDVIHCEHCGEDYSITYKRCPFCDEQQGDPQSASPRSPQEGRRMAADGGGGIDLLRIIGVVIPLALIVAALYIIITVLGPMISAGRGEDPDASASASGTAAVESPAVTDGTAGTDGGEDPDPSVSPAVSAVTAITLSQSDFTLLADSTYQISAAVTPADAADTLTWSVDQPDALSVTQDGTVTNINTGSDTVTVTVTAASGNVSATCLVRCRGGSSGNAAANPSPSTDPSPSASAGTTSSGTLTTGNAVVTDAGNGLRVRSGPGTDQEVLASLTNGSQVTVVSDAGNGWYQITFRGSGGATVTGYVKGDYLTNQ